MNTWDWLVVVLYLTGLVIVAARLSRRHDSLRDYYLAGHGTVWWQSGLSTMATQLGAISFVSAPAFVALKEGGGLKWLTYEFGVPLGLLIVIAVIIPHLHRGRFISIYEYLEHRFDRRVRLAVSLLFQFGRGLATAVSVLAGGLILSTALGVSTAAAIIVVGLITLVYAILGGIRIVILSDVLQMGIIVVGMLICGGFALQHVGWETAWQALSPDRAQIFDFSHTGLTAEGEYAFWPMLFGGLFLYASYYGCDQSQVQRELSVGSLRGVRKSLLLNAVGRFPVVLLYCLMGVAVGAVVLSAEGMERLAANQGVGTGAIEETLRADPDRMLPMFILAYLPHGIVGFVFIAILSALMSSLDSAINSLSAVTLRDVYQPYVRPGASEAHYLVVSKWMTAFWGVFCIVGALAFAGLGESTRETTLVLINAVGSLLYGPILAAFLLGMVVARVRAADVLWGVGGGIVGNLVIWQFTDVSWLWWNVIGFVVASGIAIGLAVLRPAVVEAGRVAAREERQGLRLTYASIVGWFIVMLMICALIQRASAG